MGGGTWTRCVISHIVMRRVTIAVEFPPVPNKEFQGAPVAYYVEQTAGVSERITVQNSLRSIDNGETPRDERALWSLRTVQRRCCGSAVLR